MDMKATETKLPKAPEHVPARAGYVHPIQQLHDEMDRLFDGFFGHGLTRWPGGLLDWEPFRELAALQNEMSRFMNGLLEGNGRTDQSWIPTADVWETEDEVVYAFDVPGIPEEKIAIEVKEDTLTVSAERERTEEASEEGFYRFERRYGTFARAVGLPQGVDQDQIAASYDNGVLEIRVPKPEEQKPRRIALSTTVDAS